MHGDIQIVIALGVGLHLLAALAKAIFRSPRQQAQITAIEGKVDDILGHLADGVNRADGVKGSVK